MFGQDEARLLGENVMDHIREQDREAVAEIISELQHPPYRGQMEQRIMTKQGLKWFSWAGAALRDRQGKAVAITAVARDITEQKKVETALKKSESLFNLITGNTSALVSIHDSETHYLYASPSHERLGYSPEELVGQSGFTMVVKEDIPLMLTDLEQARQGSLSKTNIDYRLRDKSGRIHHFRGSFDAVFKPDGSLERIVSVAEDITELRKAHAQREKALTLAGEAKKLALVGQVAGKMAHDFNNILGIIMGISELALMDNDVDGGDEEISKNLEMIRDQSLRGKNLTKNLVAFAKSQEPKQEFFQINEKINLVLDLMKKDLENIQVSKDYSLDMLDLLADASMIEHTLVNLLQNAVHALGKTTAPRIRISTFCRESEICFEIEDNGCGIPKEHIKNIYEPSFTLKGIKDTQGVYDPETKGTGYGMANVKKYVDQHNGQIELESTSESGTTVRVSLPVIQKELSIGEKIELQADLTHTGKSILLVEDEAIMAEVLSKILTQEPCDHKVDIADEGEAAIKRFDNGNYDIVSLDYILPGPLSGMDVYTHIRERDKTIPIVFVSGNLEFLESIETLKEQDPYLDHQSKPCKHIDYLSCINQLLTRCDRMPQPLSNSPGK